MEKKEEKKVCCICGKEYEGYGYNPFPVKEVGTTQGFSTW